MLSSNGTKLIKWVHLKGLMKFINQECLKLSDEDEKKLMNQLKKPKL